MSGNSTTSEAPAASGRRHRRAVAVAKAFVSAHGHPARAVVENIGRTSARVVLIGKDGALGDVVVRDVPAGEAVVGALEHVEQAEWDRETVDATKIGAEHRRRMAGPRARR